MDQNQSSTSTPQPIVPDISSYVDAYTPPGTSAAPVSTPTATPAPTTTSNASESLEDQNIFFMLGIDNIKEDEKESFLDELQQVIWEDFLESDVELLLTQDELAEFKKIAEGADSKSPEIQNKMVEYLEKYIPDLEKIMLEKALELKEEMMMERIKDLREVHERNEEMTKKIQAAADLISDQKWYSGAAMLNSIPQY